jgi:hypothetical protein
MPATEIPCRQKGRSGEREIRKRRGENETEKI